MKRDIMREDSSELDEAFARRRNTVKSTSVPIVKDPKRESVTSKGYCIDEYTIRLFRIKIVESSGQKDRNFTRYYIPEEEREFHISAELERAFLEDGEEKLRLIDLTSARIMTLSELFIFVGSFLRERFSFLSKSTTDLLQLVFWAKICRIRQILPLLIDPAIDEFFIFPQSSTIVIDHQKHGRMATKIEFSPSETDWLLKRLARDSSKDLSETSSSLRTEFRIEDLFCVRVTGDIPPTAIEGSSANFRKLRSEPLNLADLVRIQTLTPEAAAFLDYMINQGASVSIVGPSGSGKTTLQTALVEALPEHWRILTLENVLEYVQNKTKDRHLIRYRTESVETSTRGSTHVRLLHRTPDYANLGEILSREEALNWYDLLSGGIPSIQTLHSRGIHSVLSRLKNVFSIPESLLLASQPHIFVEIQRFLFNTKGKRIVLSIAELGQKSDDFPMLDEIFCWNSETETLENTKPFDDLQSWNFLKKKSPQSHIKDLSEAHNFH